MEAQLLPHVIATVPCFLPLRRMDASPASHWMVIAPAVRRLKAAPHAWRTADGRVSCCTAVVEASSQSNAAPAARRPNACSYQNNNTYEKVVLNCWLASKSRLGDHLYSLCRRSQSFASGSRSRSSPPFRSNQSPPFAARIEKLGRSPEFSLPPIAGMVNTSDSPNPRSFAALSNRKFLAHCIDSPFVSIFVVVGSAVNRSCLSCWGWNRRGLDYQK